MGVVLEAPEGRLTKPLSYIPLSVLTHGKEDSQMIERLAVNRAERMRWRAFHIEARKGNWKGYHTLVALSLEVPSIRVQP